MWIAESADHPCEQHDPPGGISAQNPAMRKWEITAIFENLIGELNTSSIQIISIIFLAQAIINDPGKSSISANTPWRDLGAELDSTLG